jgi:aminoglycoside phosphotransferase (APT) family kinase protein
VAEGLFLGCPRRPDVPTVCGVRLHPDEVDIDSSLVRGLLAVHYPQWMELPLIRVRSHGTDNVLYRLGDELVVR